MHARTHTHIRTHTGAEDGLNWRQLNQSGLNVPFYALSWPQTQISHLCCPQAQALQPQELPCCTHTGPP